MERPGEQRSRRSSHLIIVDDEDEQRQALARLLTRSGYQVARAADAQAAMDRLAEGDIGIVLIDADMPEPDGFELCSRIREKYGTDLYLILRCSKEALFSRSISADEGADDFLIAPHSDREVVARVETGRKMKELQARLEETSRSLALIDVTDSLTGTYNRNRTDSELRRELERARRYGRSLGLAILDIDRFRLLNEQHGRSFCDRVLKEIAHLLSDSLRRSDFIGRFSGEQFAVLLPETEIDQALGAAEKLRTLIAETPIRIKDKTVNLTVSIGVATFTDNNFENADELVEAALEALAKAKAAGRNCCVEYAR